MVVHVTWSDGTGLATIGWPCTVDPGTYTYLRTPAIYPCKQTCHRTENLHGTATKLVSPLISFPSQFSSRKLLVQN